MGQKSKRSLTHLSSFVLSSILEYQQYQEAGADDDGDEQYEEEQQEE